MKSINFIFVSIAILFACQSGIKSNQSTILLKNVQIIDGTGAPATNPTDILIVGERIQKIGKIDSSKISYHLQALDLKGRFVLPGFIEMHAHMPGDPFEKEVCQTMLDFGITTVRNPAASPETGVVLRNKLASGEINGPRLFTAGMLIDSPESVYNSSIKVETEDEIRNVVQQQAKTGIDYIKLYTGLKPDLVRAAIDETHKQGLEIIGHLGVTSWTFAANAGIDGLLHSCMAGPTWELIPEVKRDKFRNLANPTRKFNPELFKGWRENVDLNGPEMDNLIEALVKNHVVVDPTLVMMEAMIWGNDEDYREKLEPDFAPQLICDIWRKELHPYTFWWSETAFREAKKTFPIFLEIVRKMHEAGVLLTTGTDYGNPWITPGVSLHREFELLVKAGITPNEVIKIATQNGAEALHILNNTGTIQCGKYADLVILSDNPLNDIRNTRKIEMVFMKGKIVSDKESVVE